MNTGVCTRKEVQNGDSCPILALKYSLKVTEIEAFNAPNTCGPSWPNAGQVICVSAGNLPKIAEVGKDGLCSTYIVLPGQTCISITENSTFTITESMIQSFNNKTCSTSWPAANQTICISSGFLPVVTTNSKNDPNPLVTPILISVFIFVGLVLIITWTSRSCFKKSKKADELERKDSQTIVIV